MVEHQASILKVMSLCPMSHWVRCFFLLLSFLCNIPVKNLALLNDEKQCLSFISIFRDESKILLQLDVQLGVVASDHVSGYSDH